jgi:hypothetical protein
MLKNIKKSIKYFIIVLGVFTMLPTVLYILLQTSSVQTYLVKRITSHYSNQFKSTISIGSIEYRFFNKLSVNDMLIKDKNNDTLVYSEKVLLGIKRLDFKKKSIRLGRVSFIKPGI